MGPYVENPKYYQECLDLVASLKLEDVEFTGNVNVAEYMVKLDALILSSISEGQPLSILEGLAAGVPYVATDVGSCREILYGYHDDDKFGDAGIIVPVMDFESMAEAILKMAKNKPLREAMGMAGRERVKKYYGYDDFINNYRAIYEEMFPV
jgi:glycosyltransferase involved in cell wall biosynthesis